MASKLFNCEQCNAFGKITLRSEEYDETDVVCCPICGSDISEVDDDYEEEE